MHQRMFVTACSMDEYAEEKRTEKNLIVRSGISEAETTNNKRLHSTFCIEAIQTRSIAWPLCDNHNQIHVAFWSLCIYGLCCDWRTILGNLQLSFILKNFLFPWHGQMHVWLLAFALFSGVMFRASSSASPNLLIFCLHSLTNMQIVIFSSASRLNCCCFCDKWGY